MDKNRIMSRRRANPAEYLNNMAAPVDLENLFVREVELNDGKSIQIYQSMVGDVGCVVWDAALVLSKYLETDDFNGGDTLWNKRVVDLGSGTGVVGLTAACHRANVAITDLPEFVPLMQKNVDANKDHFTHPVRAQSLTWGESLDASLSHTDIVLIADCVYYEVSIEPLVKTIEELCDENTVVYCCYEERLTGNKPELQKKFFQLITRQFSIEEIPMERQDEHFRSDDIHIWKFMRKKVS